MYHIPTSQPTYLSHLPHPYIPTHVPIPCTTSLHPNPHAHPMYHIPTSQPTYPSHVPHPYIPTHIPIPCTTSLHPIPHTHPTYPSSHHTPPTSLHPYSLGRVSTFTCIKQTWHENYISYVKP
jgi:hypothetical protein